MERIQNIENVETAEIVVVSRNVYCPDKGVIFNLKAESLGFGNGDCPSSKARKLQEEKNSFSCCAFTGSFKYQGIQFVVLNFLYINPLYFEEDENDSETVSEDKAVSQDNKCKVPRSPLATLDIFFGCGGLSEGLEKSGASVTRWAIEFDQMAAEAFKLNHPDAYTVVQDCNVVLRDVMMPNGDADDCIPSTDASSSALKLDDEVLSRLPRPGDVDLIIPGPPCQGFFVLNRYTKTSMSDSKRTMILSLLSYVDYFISKYLEILKDGSIIDQFDLYGCDTN